MRDIFKPRNKVYTFPGRHSYQRRNNLRDQHYASYYSQKTTMIMICSVAQECQPRCLVAPCPTHTYGSGYRSRRTEISWSSISTLYQTLWSSNLMNWCCPSGIGTAGVPGLLCCNRSWTSPETSPPSPLRTPESLRSSHAPGRTDYLRDNAISCLIKLRGNALYCTWERQYLQPLSSMTGIQFHELRVVGAGQPSLAGHVHNEERFLASEGCQLDGFSADALCREVEDGQVGFLGAGRAVGRGACTHSLQRVQARDRGRYQDREQNGATK